MLHLEIITPDQIVFDSEVESVTLPTGNGEITILTHHIPLMTTAVPGSLVARAKGEEHLFAISRGTIEIDGAGIRVLVRTADDVDALADEEAIMKAKESAEKLMEEKRTDAEAFAEATALFDRELARSIGARRRSTLRRSPMPPTQQ